MCEPRFQIRVTRESGKDSFIRSYICLFIRPSVYMCVFRLVTKLKTIETEIWYTHYPRRKSKKVFYWRHVDFSALFSISQSQPSLSVLMNVNVMCKIFEISVGGRHVK